MDHAPIEPSDRRSDEARSPAPGPDPGHGQRAAFGGTPVIPLRPLPVEWGRGADALLARPDGSVSEWTTHNLPHPLTSFIGREQQIAEIRRLLQTTRLLTLTGSGGVGKTRLSHEVAAGLVDVFQDGVWLVELAALAEAAQVPKAVASVLELREEPDRPLTVTLAHELRADHLLVVLDNCEHLLEACAALADALLRACPELRILATSRQALGITGETTYLVPSLSLTAPLDAPTQPAPREDEARASVAGAPPMRERIELPTQSEAVRLFVERALAAVPTFTLTDRNAAAVEQICRRLDGIPLALELAAARVAVLSPEQIAARLGDRFSLLTGGSRTARPRYRTLRALIDWSHDLLDERERTLFRRLAVFAGGWTLEAAEAVCAFGALSPHEVLDLLSGLVAKSLVLAAEHDDEVRYRFLESLREYAVEKLLESDEQTALRERHREWVLGLAEQAEPELIGPRQEVWFDRLDRERENLRAAARWAATRGDAETIVRLGAALWQFWLARADATDAREWIDAIVPLAQQVSPIPALARALHGAGMLAVQLADYATSRSLLEEGLAVARQLGDRRTLAALLDTLGRQAFIEGRYTEARALLNESLAILRETDDRRGLTRTLSHLGFLDYLEDRQESARAIYREGLELAREGGDPGEVAEFLDNLGRTFHADRDLDGAARAYQEAVAILREIGQRHRLAMALNNLGNVMTLQGEVVAARALLREALTLSRPMGNRRRLAFVLAAVATQAAVEGQTALAVRLEAAAFATADAIGAVLARPAHRLSAERLARAHRALGAPAAAAAVAAGRALTLEQAVDEALAWLAEPESSAQVAVRPGGEAPPTVPLSPRELEVAALIARGLTNRQIAAELVIAEGTAATHVKHILARLDLDSRVQVAAWAIEHGLHQRSPS